MEANRFKNVSELIKSFEEYSGFSIDPEEIDTRDKLLDKISEIQKKDLCRKHKSLYLLVPRDRIELPTRGFSVPCSTN